MTCHNFAATKFDSSSFQRLSPQNSTIRAVVGLPNSLNNLIHSPSIKFLIRQNFKWQFLFLLISFDSFQRVISISFDSLINSKHIKLNPVFILFVKFVQNMHQHRRIFPSTCSQRYFVAFFEQLVFDDCLMDFFLKIIKETVLAYGLACLWTFYHSFVGFALLALQFWHPNCFLLYLLLLIYSMEFVDFVILRDILQPRYFKRPKLIFNISMRDNHFSFSTSTPMKSNPSYNFTNNSSHFSSSYQSSRKSRVRENYQNRQQVGASLFASDYDLQTSHFYNENPEMRSSGKFDQVISNREVEELFQLKRMVNFYNFQSKENTAAIQLKEKVLQATKFHIQQKERDIRLLKQKFERQRDRYRRSKMKKQQIQKRNKIHLRRNSEDLTHSIQMMRKGSSFSKHHSNQSFTEKKQIPKSKKVIEICCPQYVYYPQTPTYYRAPTHVNPPWNVNPSPQQPSVIDRASSSLFNASDISHKRLSIHCYISETILMKRPQTNVSQKKNQSSLNTSRQFSISLRSCSRSSTKAKKEKGNYIYSKEKRRQIGKSSFLGQNFDFSLSDLLEPKKQSESFIETQKILIARQKGCSQQNINSSVINIKVSNAEQSSENKSSLVDSFKKSQPIKFICSLKKKKDSEQNIGSSGLDQLPSSLPQRQGQSGSSQKDQKKEEKGELDNSIESLPIQHGSLQSLVIQKEKMAQKEKEEESHQIASLPVIRGLLQTLIKEQQVNSENKVEDIEDNIQNINNDLDHKPAPLENIENVEENTQCKEMFILNTTLQSKKVEEESCDDLQQIKLLTVSKESRKLKTTQQSFSSFRQTELKESKNLTRSKSYSSEKKW